MSTDLAAAVALLRAGRLVAFPTETVYGLGADAADSLAVRRIFSAKGRPSTNPLIVHVASADAARRYATAWPATADRLAEAFWPGPLTLVLPRSPAIAPEVSAGGPTVGLRVPDHPLALALLAVFDGPVAAPSANRANHVSPTTADHVRSELGGRVDLILDGGPCAVGIESTVVDLTGDVPAILRPGGISAEQLSAVLGRPVDVVSGSDASPGQGRRHYAPVTPAYRWEAGQPVRPNAAVLRCDTTPAEYARTLYARLRSLDGTADAILVQMPPDTPAWAAVRDRLMRATVE